MICKPCSLGIHGQCLDLPRRHAQERSLIPAVAPNTSMWCYCQHEERGAGESRAAQPPEMADHAPA